MKYKTIGKRTNKLANRFLLSLVYPVEIEYIFGGRPIRRSMNISVAVAVWDPNGNNGRGKIRASVPDSARFNKLPLTKVNKVDTELNEYNQKFPGQINEDIIAAFLNDKPLTPCNTHSSSLP